MQQAQIHTKAVLAAILLAVWPGEPLAEHLSSQLLAPPYDQPAWPGWSHVWSRHAREILVLALLGLLSSGLILFLAISNARLRQARRHIAASEQRWLAALDGSGHGVWDWDARTNQVFYSRRWKEMLGYREQDISPHFNEWSRRVHPDDFAETLQQVEAHRRGELDQLSILHRLRAKDGTYRWILGRSIALERNQDGEALRILGTNTDLTRYHGVEIALADKESLFLALVSQAPNGMGLVEPETRRFVQFNPALHHMLGYSYEQFECLTIQDLDAGHSLAEQQARIDEIQRQGLVIFDTQLRHNSGQLRDVRVSARCITQGGYPYIAMVFNDLTDLRRAERERLASQQDFQATFEQAAVGMATIAPDGRFLRVNSKLAEMLGYSTEELGYRHFQSLTHPEDLDKNLELFAQLSAGEIPYFQIEKRYIHNTDDIVWTLVTMSLVRTATGEFSHFIAVIEDINERKEAEEQLHVAAQMVDRAAFAIIATDMNGVIRQYNPAAARLLGYPAEQMIGHMTPLRFHLDSEIDARAAELSKVYGEEIAPGFGVFTEPALREGQDIREWTLRRHDGETLNVLLSITVLRDSAGQPQGVLGNLADITPLHRATKALRKERNRAQWYLDNVSSMIVALDLDGRITLVNSYSCELLGRTEQALLYQDWFELCIPAAQRAAMRRLFAQCLLNDTKHTSIIETQIQCADGSLRLIAWCNRLLHDMQGRVSGVLAAGNDITERQALEQARSEALAEAERLATLKNNFLANMSHEIRTPLNGILGVAEIGRRDHDTDAAGQLFQHIERAGKHLMTLLNDILDLSKLEAGKLSIQPEPLCLSDCLAAIESLFNPQARAKGLSLIIDCAPDLPAYILIDPTRLHQILFNLLGNAVKFTTTGEVRLSVVGDRGHIRFRITDTGIGMSETQMARIFQPFEQAEKGTTRIHGGTGLGLAISQSLADLMGGEIHVESEPNIGSCFELRLPLQAAQAPPEHNTTDSAPQGFLTGQRILVVDDVELNRLVLSDLLGNRGARITTAVNGEDALAKLTAAREAFDLVLMDVQMPIMDGYEATRRIQAQWPELPVIGLTAHALREARERCLEAGMVAHLTKPIDIAALVRIIDRYRSSAPALHAVPEPSWINWAALQQRFEHSTTHFIPRLVKTALESQQDTPARLRTITSLDDFFRLCHALKGFAANLCAEPLHKQADRLCEQARAGDPNALNEAAALADTLEQTLNEMASAFSAIR